MAEQPILIEERGATLAAFHLSGMGEAARDPRDAFRKMQADLAGAEASWFATAGRGSWPPLTERTREIKSAAGLASQIMVATGALRRSLTARSGGGESRQVTPTEMHFGTDVIYARFHRKSRPPLVPVDEKFRRAACDTISEHLLAPTKRGTVV